MSFLNASLLWGLIPLLGLPLVIHLLNKRFPRLFHFSSVQHIRDTAARQSRLYRWRHRILLLVRTLLLLLLLLAFLKPVWPKFGAFTAAQGARYVLILIDHSLSMEYKGESVSCRQRAIQEAEKLIATLGPNDRLNVVLVDHRVASCFVDFSQNHPEAKRFLNRMKPGVGPADFSQANVTAGRLFTKVAGRAELYYLSDFQRKNWAHVDFTPLPSQVPLFFVDVSTRTKDNHALLGATIHHEQILAGDTVPLEITVGNFAAQPFHNRVTVVLDEKYRFETDCEVAPWSVTKVTLPVSPGAPGLHRCEISLPPDGLAADNRFHLSLPVLEKEEIVILSDAPESRPGANTPRPSSLRPPPNDSNPHPPPLQPRPSTVDTAYFLATALNPYEQLHGSLLPRRLRTSELSPGQLAGCKKIFMTQVGPLNEAACELLTRFLFQGGGIIYFLDGPDDAANLNRWEKALGAGTIPLKLYQRRIAENVAASSQQILKGDFKSRFLKLFRGALRQNLALLEFYDYWRASATGSGNILLTYADETPAMASLAHGLGTALLLNFSASELSSNLARQRLFPAWMQELVKNLTNDEPVPTSHVIGEVIQSEVWRKELKDRDLKSPSGEAVTLKREMLGERFSIAFVPEELGFYTLSSDRLLYAFGVNSSPDEADLRAVDKAILPDPSQGGRSSPHMVAGQEDYQTLVHGQPLFHWFILAGCALLMLELALQLLFRNLAS